MSVPTHNLYDFVHQTTKKQYSIMYYQRWGSRNLMDVYPYQTSDAGLNGPRGIALKDRYTIPELPIDLVNYAWSIISTYIVLS